MAVFKFDIRSLFPQPIVKVDSSLLPHTFHGNRRQALEATAKMSAIIDHLGQLSAIAQKLNIPITTAQKLRKSDNQIVYLMADFAEFNSGRGDEVVGLLKIGMKDLYLFDELGQSRKVDNAPCILDFYVHDKRQRSGLGKKTFPNYVKRGEVGAGQVFGGSSVGEAFGILKETLRSGACHTASQSFCALRRFLRA
uniref:Alpha-tubulin N-acetyltransferase 1 n=1 Tax=Bactrocera latifrons TaxID=174628 RepID=A0A0K8UJK7_BACLA